MRVVHKRRKGIKLSLIIFIILFFSVTISFVINTIVGFETQKSSLKNNTLDMNLITATEISRTTQTILLSMQDSLKAAADYIANDDWDLKSTQQRVDFLRASVPYFNSVILVDSSGMVTFTSPEALNIKGTRLTSAQTRDALEKKKPLISAPYMSITNRMIVLASYPIFDKNGRYRGFIGGSIYLRESNVFQKLLGQQRVNENGAYYYVVDSSGTLIFHPDADRIGENDSGNPAVKELMLGQSGEMELKNAPDERVLAGYSNVPASGWGIVFQTPEENVEYSVTRVVTRMSLISIPLMVLLVLLAVLISQRLAFSINRLVYAALRLKWGDASVKDLPETRSWIYESQVLYEAVSGAFRTLDKKAEDFSLQARTDMLTGLTNRRRLDALVEDWVQQRLPFSVIMLDIDHFKQVNDTYGHQMGDETLRFLAGLMNKERGEGDHCCRYGGEEFTILMPFSNAEQALKLAERIRKRMEREVGPTGTTLTLSLGISEFPACAPDAQTLFQQADVALYQAKGEGRNRSVVYRAKESKQTTR